MSQPQSQPSSLSQGHAPAHAAAPEAPVQAAFARTPAASTGLPAPELASRIVFNLDTRQFEHFSALINAPLALAPSLALLMSRPAPWEAATSAPSPAYSVPHWLTGTHELSGFDCGDAFLNDWLGRRAWIEQQAGSARTFVVTDARQHVTAYFSVALATVARAAASLQGDGRGAVGVCVLTRLAVDKQAHGHQLGAALLREALRCAQGLAVWSGARALLVQASDAGARNFYERHGFQDSSLHPLCLLLPLPLPAPVG